MADNNPPLVRQLSLFSSEAMSPAAAPRQAGGFSYQLLYATLQALELEEGEVLGYEFIDDVDVRGPDGARVFQIKNEVTPLTDMSKGLWRALANWVPFIASGPNHNLQLIFATTSPIRGEFPRLLAEDTPRSKKAAAIKKGRVEPTPGEMRRKYVETIPNSKDPNLNDDIQKIKGLPAPQLALLLSKVRVVAAKDTTEILARIASKIRERFHDNDVESAAQQFQGWVHEKVATALSVGRGARIDEEQVHNFVQNMRDGCAPNRPQFRHLSTAIDPTEKAEYRTSTFYRQLEAIDWPADLSDMALVDYLRIQREEVEWAKRIEVDRRDLVNYRSEIHDTWRILSHDVRGERKGLDEKEAGRHLCDAMLRSQSPQLRNVVPPSHVFRGTCHQLANIPQLGWHPRWDGMFSDPNDPVKPAGER